MNGFCRGRTSRYEDIHRYELVDRARFRQQSWYHTTRNLLIELCVLDVGTMLDRCDRKPVAHTGNVCGYGTITQRNQNSGSFADFLDFFQIFFTANRSFDQYHIDVMRELLGIDQGAMDQVYKTGQLNQPLVHVEE